MIGVLHIVVARKPIEGTIVELPSVVVEASLPDGQTYRTMLPGGCVLILGEQSIEKSSR
jgi:hypothetical protein